MPVGYVQISVGIAGPLLLDGFEYSVPMATMEGCLIANTNRGCKAIHLSGGATSVLLRDGMTRALVVRFNSAKRASELKFFLEDPENFKTLSIIFNRSSRFARLQGIQCAIAGKNVYIRFTCSTGDAMGMNMVSKGVQNVLDFLQNDFDDMDVIGISEQSSWNEELTFSLKEPNGVLNLEVFDKDLLKTDDKMGHAQLSLQPLVSAARLRQILQNFNGETVLRKVVPDSDNCLVRESSITCVNV
ncbi:3-hydroxy-3-methylglutaryl-coenzyme A reductase 2-like [Humulus lupulus]|uniref:3-hydroxy-3-methylglutaryl-coenzyme A reductase 2-like n=1 Tax=Humulus lupulus TaxID=3486 RepID=UPI002B402F5C|nr:3-hydroxy-3-methylglutaryl-coenzyme A reductase 2-like [Humulus lupulus]XP_062094196.1 3-hydroxy-3-methylglutaryl-coenzyme A reductase 2-like [Humulus lupulus]